jgi:hypothetical protein
MIVSRNSSRNWNRTQIFYFGFGKTYQSLSKVVTNDKYFFAFNQIQRCVYNENIIQDLK